MHSMSYLEVGKTAKSQAPVGDFAAFRIQLERVTLVSSETQTVGFQERSRRLINAEMHRVCGKHMLFYAPSDGISTIGEGLQTTATVFLEAVKEATKPSIPEAWRADFNYGEHFEFTFEIQGIYWGEMPNPREVTVISFSGDSLYNAELIPEILYPPITVDNSVAEASA